MQDDLEQKIDKLTVMMGKLVTEDDGCSKPFRPLIYHPGRGRNQNRGNFCGRLRNNMHTEDAHCTIKTLEVDIEVTSNNRGNYAGIMLEVVRDTETIIKITAGIIIEVKSMTEIEVGH